MTQNKKTKKVVKKKRKLKTKVLVSRCISFVLVLLSAYFVYQIVTEVKQTYELGKDLEDAQETLKSIEEENQYLIEQKDKLMDPEYVKGYARGLFSFSKDGEQVFRLPQVEENK